MEIKMPAAQTIRNVVKGNPSLEGIKRAGPKYITLIHEHSDIKVSNHGHIDDEDIV